MAKKKTCCECGKSLTKDEVALTRKLTDVDTDEFYCLTCFAEYLGCEKEDLKVMQQEVPLKYRLTRIHTETVHYGEDPKPSVHKA